MANKLWVGTDSGNEGDWATAANWSPSGVPINADDVFFTSGSQDVTDGLNQSAIALDSLRVGEGYSGDIGDSTTSLQIDAAEFMYAGQGDCYIDGDLDTVQVTGALGDNALELDGDIDTLRVIGSGF